MMDQVPARVTVMVNAASIALGTPVQKGFPACTLNRRSTSLLLLSERRETEMFAELAFLVASSFFVDLL